jgi:hypothetical protein
MTLLELLIALGIASAVLMGLNSTVQQGRELFRAQDQNLQLDGDLSRAAASVSRHLMPANAGSLLPDLTPIPGAPTPWSNTLRYRSFADFTVAGIQWSAQRELRWELDPGELLNDLDDDGDGSIDEGVLVWLENEGLPDARRAIVASGVSELLEGEAFNGLDDNGNGLIDEAGAAFEQNGSVLTLHLTVEDVQPGNPRVQRTRRIRTQLRN